MNIRLVAVDAEGREIERDDDDHSDLVPVNSVQLDAVPRVGDEMLFYNTHGRDFTWMVSGVVWMVSPNERNRGDGYGHVCVMLQRKPHG